MPFTSWLYAFGTVTPLQGLLLAAGLFFTSVCLVGYNGIQKRKGHKAPFGILTRLAEQGSELYWRMKEEKQRKAENQKEIKSNEATQKVFDDAAGFQRGSHR